MSKSPPLMQRSTLRHRAPVTSVAAAFPNRTDGYWQTLQIQD